MNVRLRSRTVSGNEFQIEGPEVAKLRDPYRAKSTAWNCQLVMLKDIWDKLPIDSIRRLVLNVQKRLQACVKADDGHFEHLLR